MRKPSTGLAAVIAMLFFLCPVYARSQPSPAAERDLLSDAKRASDGDDLQRIERLESRALEGAGASAYRDDGKLVLRMSSNADKIYKDADACKIPGQEAKCIKYRLVAHVRSIGVFLLAKLYYESAEYLLINDANGSETGFRNFPIFSPSGGHVLVFTANDEQVGFAIQIWRRDGQQFRLDWQGAPNYHGMYIKYRLLNWRSEGTIELESDMNAGPAKPEVIKRFHLHETPNGWTVGGIW